MQFLAKLGKVSLLNWDFFANSPFLHLSAGFLLTKINIGKTGNQNPPQGGGGGFVVTCISNTDIF